MKGKVQGGSACLRARPSSFLLFSPVTSSLHLLFFSYFLPLPILSFRFPAYCPFSSSSCDALEVFGEFHLQIHILFYIMAIDVNDINTEILRHLGCLS